MTHADKMRLIAEKFAQQVLKVKYPQFSEFRELDRSIVYIINLQNAEENHTWGDAIAIVIFDDLQQVEVYQATATNRDIYTGKNMLANYVTVDEGTSFSQA